ncbi:uncharacterized protein LOC142338474 isoform X2 [Convolutriloba macropyga]|uniref:uncharacterized protein LOC142338474 isoform X2 n=1 Tax=Convolutriloba macropyga TaxID=536237 RepID=UPI003F5256F1
MANYPHLRFYPGPDLLLKDAIEKEAKSSISQALLVSDKARFQAQQIKRRALFRRAGLKTPEEEMYTSSSKLDQQKTSAFVSELNSQNNQNNSNPFNLTEEFTFGLSSYPPGKSGGRAQREKTSMEGIMTGRYSRAEYSSGGGGGEQALGNSSESLDKYNTLLAGNKDDDHFENPAYPGSKYTNTANNSVARNNSQNNKKHNKSNFRYLPSNNLRLAAVRARESEREPVHGRDLFKMRKFANVKSRTDHSWS